jgi:hypothetical protein
MIAFNEKAKTYFLLGAAILVGVIHIFHPVTLSPTNVGGRTGFMSLVLLFAVLAKMGYSFGRIGIAVSFLICSLVNLLIAAAYGASSNLSSFLEIVFWALILGIIGSALLFWKDARVFEKNRLTQETRSI